MPLSSVASKCFYIHKGYQWGISYIKGLGYRVRIIGLYIYRVKHVSIIWSVFLGHITEYNVLYWSYVSLKLRRFSLFPFAGWKYCTRSYAILTTNSPFPENFTHTTATLYNRMSLSVANKHNCNFKILSLVISI